ncbi:MAG: RDD family protein [Rhodobacterales bacterium]|nr:RDD family protein [Rhodobacterales bacterium]NCT12831.1 RDD family protein [Rhodobacterales bacterium]
MSAQPFAHGLPDPVARADFYDGVATRRLLAWLADVVLILVLCLLILPFTAFTGIFFFPALMLVTGFLYRWATLAGGSATWGMRLMGIELREGDGGRLHGATAFWHTLAYTLAVAMAPLQLVSVLMMALTPRGQGLGDSLLGTAAINRPL